MTQRVNTNKIDRKAANPEPIYADDGMLADGKKRWPLDTKEHVQAADDDWSDEKNHKPYTQLQRAKITTAIEEAKKNYGLKSSQKSAPVDILATVCAAFRHVGNKADAMTQPAASHALLGAANATALAALNASGTQTPPFTDDERKNIESDPNPIAAAMRINRARRKSP